MHPELPSSSESTLSHKACIWLSSEFKNLLTATFNLLGWLWLTRVSLLGLALLLGLPLSAWAAARSLVIGAYDLRVSAWLGIASVGLLLILFGWSIHVAGMLVLSYGKERVGFRSDRPGWMPFAYRVAIIAGMALNLWTLFAASQPGTDVPLFEDYVTLNILLFLLLGLVVGFVLVLGVEKLHRGITCYTMNAPVAGAKEKMPEHNFYLLLKPANNKKSFMDPVAEKISASLKNWLNINQPGIGLAVFSACLFLLTYLVIHWIVNTSDHLTAFVYLLLFLNVWIWVLSGATFFFDAYRIPVLLPLIIWLVISAWFPMGDNFYRIWPAESTLGTDGLKDGTQLPALHASMNSAELLENAVKKNQRIILIAASGGGIQSAAWTARVLTGLESWAPGEFSSSIQLLSGVSGGSTGIMFFVQAYDSHGGLPPPRENIASLAPVGANNPELLERIVNAAKDTSLGQTTLGLVYPDMLRTFFPYLAFDRFRDRGELMEQAWAGNAVKDMGLAGKSLRDATLREWQVDVWNGTRPAVIFNSTADEVGVRMEFSTSSPFEGNTGADEFCMDGAGLLTRPNFSTYPGADLRITTAVRMSATFPYVSPQARPCVAASRDASGTIRPEKSDPLAKLVPHSNGMIHLGDGGYFDNSGVTALVQWLDTGFTELNKEMQANPGSQVQLPKEVLIIQIEAFPESVTNRGDDSSNETPRQNVNGRGGLFQMLAPIMTLYNVRGAGHIAFANDALDMLVTRWLNNPGGPGQQVKIERVRIVFPTIPAPLKDHFWPPAWSEALADSPPLSWHLRGPEQEAIEKAWKLIEPQDKSKIDADPDWYSDPEVEPVEKVLKFIHTPTASPTLQPSQ